MRPTHQASPLWSQTQQFRSSAAWKVLSTAPWAVAFLRAEFTSAKPRIGLEVFHASLESFLKVVRSEDPTFNDSMTAAQYADAWVKNQFLARPLVDGHFVYEPTAQTARVLKFLADFSGDRTNLNSSRLNTLLVSLESLAHETDPDPAARIRALEAEIAQRQEKITALRDGTSPAVLPKEGALAATRSVLDMASGLPADFKRMRDGVQEMLHALRGEIMESSSVKGVAIGAVLEGDKQLRSTPQGETFRGFTEFLNSPQAQVRFREAVNEVSNATSSTPLTPRNATRWRTCCASCAARSPKCTSPTAGFPNPCTRMCNPRNSRKPRCSARRCVPPNSPSLPPVPCIRARWWPPSSFTARVSRPSPGWGSTTPTNMWPRPSLRPRRNSRWPISVARQAPRNPMSLR